MTRFNNRSAALAAVFALSLAACSQAPDSPPPAQGEADVETSAAPATAQPDPAPTLGDAPGALLGAEGLGPHRVGSPVATGGASPPQLVHADNPSCHMYRDPNLPGVFIMTDGEGVIRRISVLEPSTVKTAAGIGVGAKEPAVRAAYPAMRKERSEYTAPPGGILYSAADGKPGLRFDVDQEGTVREMSGGTPPYLAFSEGCA